MAAQRASAAKAKKTTAKRTVVPVKARKAVVSLPVKTKLKVAKPEVAKPARRVLDKSKPVVAPVMATGKKAESTPRLGKTSSGLSKGDLAHFRELLLEKRREILGDVGTMESEAFKAGSNLSNMPIHMADVGTDNFEQEFTLGLIESERQILREIQEALQRIEDGGFGICLATGKAIGKVRLEAVPWAKYTMDYARALEQGLVRRDSARAADDDGGDDEEE